MSATTGTSARAGAGQRGAEPGGLSEGLEHQREDLGAGVVERVVHEVGRRRDELLARRHGERETEAAPRAQQCREDGARVGDQRDGPGREGVGLDVPDGAQSVTCVDEAHAAPAAQSHPGAARGPRHVVAQGARAVPRRAVEAAVHDGRAVATARRPLHLGREDLVAHTEEHQVDRAVDVVERSEAGHAQHLVVARVDQGELDPCRAAAELGDQPLAEGARARARAHHRHPTGLEHGAQRGPSRRGAAHARPGARRHSRCLACRRLESVIAARAACHPGIPHTPPPACVAELA